MEGGFGVGETMMTFSGSHTMRVSAIDIFLRNLSNKNKSKILVCTKKEQTSQECTKINQENLGVNEFRYLGSKITYDGRSENEIKSRIVQAKMGFNSNQKLLCFSSISLENRKML